MFLAPGQIVTLREIILGLSVSSGNDAAVAAALRIAPTVQDFAALMTAEARRMGLEKTSFVEPSGISANNNTTAAEFAVFSREYIRLHPYTLSEFHSVREFSYPKAENVPERFRNRPNTISQVNRNTLLRRFPGVDGLKTGYIDQAGFNIALTAERANTRFIAVILGAPAGAGGDRIRERDSERLLSWAFENFKTVRPVIRPLEPVKLWKGKDKTVTLLKPECLNFTAPSDRAADRYSIITDDPLIAPLPANFPAGWIVFSDDIGEVHRMRLLTAREYQQGNIFRRIWDSIRLFFARTRPAHVQVSQAVFPNHRFA
jgi:D-alanyl-D-alanine carboxypeptidase (penicillin-binding protein 5/6)